MKSGEQLLLKTFSISIILKKVYLVKICPIFADSASNLLTRYWKILSVCSLGSKNQLNFTWLTMKFHNPNHAIIHVFLFFSYTDLWWFIIWELHLLWQFHNNKYRGLQSKDLQVQLQYLPNTIGFQVCFIQLYFYQELRYTARSTTNRTFAILRSKIAFFKRVWPIVRALPRHWSI